VKTVAPAKAKAKAKKVIAEAKPAEKVKTKFNQFDSPGN